MQKRFICSVKPYFISVLCFIAVLYAFTRLYLSPPDCFARAEEQNEYLRVITDDTPFYSDKTAESPLFYLPYTYYVKVISGGDVFTRVEYGAGGGKIDGFIPTDKLYSDGLPVSDPYPQVRAVTAGTTVLYKDATLTVSIQYIFEGRELLYYGKFYSPQGKTLYYVGYNDRLGYVKEEDLTPFTVENHPNELTFLTPEKPEEPVTKEPAADPASETVSVIRIAIFAFLGLAGIIALIFAAGKKPKPSPAASYYDENDYE